jgi:hypothetical protein
MPGKTKEQEFNEMMDNQREMQNAAVLQGQNNTPQNYPSQSKVNNNEQKILNELKTQIKSPPPVSASPSQGQCPQCNLFHPPIPPGKKCPNAPIEVEGISASQVNEVVVKVKDILASQLEQKGVKDFNKFSGGLVIELMKYCEGYKE